MSIELLVVDPDDLRALRAVEQYLHEIDAAFTGGFTPEPHDLDPYRQPDGAFVVALDGERPVGCGALRQLGGGIGEVKRMWVAPTSRGAGLGRRLLERLEAEAAQRDCTLVRLDTNDVLDAALALYRSSGYVEIDRYNDNPYAHHWFEKSLGGGSRIRP